MVAGRRVGLAAPNSLARAYPDYNHQFDLAETLWESS